MTSSVMPLLRKADRSPAASADRAEELTVSLMDRAAAIRNSILKAEKIWMTSFAVYSEMHLQAADQAARQAADPVAHPAEVSGAAARRTHPAASGAAVFRTVAFRTVISAAAVPAAPEADSADMAAEASR